MVDDACEFMFVPGQNEYRDSVQSMIDPVASRRARRRFGLQRGRNIRKRWAAPISK